MCKRYRIQTEIELGIMPILTNICLSGRKGGFRAS